MDMGSLLSESLRALGLTKRIKEYECVAVWDEVVGEQVAGAAQPEGIRDGRMFVAVKSSVWANELTLLKPDIISRLNRRVGGNALKDIIFKAGRVPNRKKSPIKESAVGPDIEGIPLTDAELERVEAAASASGEDASEDIRRLLTTALCLEKWKQMQGWTPCKLCGTLQNTESGVCPPCEIQGE